MREGAALDVKACCFAAALTIANNRSARLLTSTDRNHGRRRFDRRSLTRSTGCRDRRRVGVSSRGFESFDWTNPVSPSTIGRREFTVMIAMIMALTALAIDIMLPTFGAVRTEFGLAADSTAPAAIVTFFFLGLATAQVFFGPMADRFGRKPVLYAGLALYIASALAATFAPTLEMVLISRFIWGVGAAAPRVVALSVVRDSYRGEAMARTMSIIMSIFVLVPVIAWRRGAKDLHEDPSGVDGPVDR